MRQLGPIVLLAFILAGCDITDAATRLAYDLEREANTLRASADTTRTFAHHPKDSPEGVSGSYIVTFKAGPSGYLGFSKGQWEVWYHTSYHRRFVEVPKDLRVQKGAGEPFTVVLTRSGDTVEVTELR